MSLTHLSKQLDVAVHRQPFRVGSLIFKSVTNIIYAEGYLHVFEMAPYFFSTHWINGAIGVVVYFDVGGMARSHQASQEVKMFFDQEWLTASEF